MNEPDVAMRRSPVEQILRIDALCDQFEDARQKGEPLAVADFLCREGIDPATAPPDLLRELVRLDAVYRMALPEGSDPADTRPFPRSDGSIGHRATSRSGVFQDLVGYEVFGELGHGGMGVVFEARQVMLNRTVALKRIRAGISASPAQLSRFRTEAEAVARTQHPNVVQVFEIGEQDGLPFFSMEFCGGGNLAKKLAKNPLPPDEAARTIQAVALGVQAAHTAEVLHRDLKPANIMLATDGTPKVADFGLAKLMDRSDVNSISGHVMGTPSYMAPEQASGDTENIGPTADVYALGAVFYECLTGRPPFKGATLTETLIQVKTQEPVAIRQLQPNVPRDLETVCHKCLEKDAGRRYASAKELAEDLGRYLRREPILARPVGRVERTVKWARRQPAAAALVAVVIGSLIAALVVGAERYAANQRELRWAEWDRYERNIRDAGEALAQSRYGVAEAILADCPNHLRDVEWHVLHTSCRSNLRHRLDHGSHIRSIAADLAGGKRIATAGMDGRVILWDAETGKQVAVLRSSSKPLNNLASGSRGQYLAAAWDEGTNVWDVTTDPPTLVLDQKIGGQVAMAQNAKLVAVGQRDHRVVAWNLANPVTDASVFTADYPGAIRCLVLSPDGSRLAVGGFGSRSRNVPFTCWDLTKQQPLDHFRVDNRIGSALCLVWGPGNCGLVSASNQSGVIWDTLTGHPTGNFPVYETSPTGLAVDQGGRYLTACFGNGSIKVWALEQIPRLMFSRKPDRRDVKPESVCVGFDPTGELLAYSQGSEVHVERWKSSGGVRAVPGHCFAFTADGTRLATGMNDGSLRWLDATSGREINKTAEGKPPAVFLATSPDGARVAVARGKAVWLWGPESGREIEHHAHPGNVLCVGYSRAGLLASSDDLGNIHVHDAKTGTVVRKLPHGGAVASVAFSPDGRRLAAGDLDWRVNLWDTESWEAVELAGHELGVTSVAFSPDGRWLASGSVDQTVRLWEIRPSMSKQSRESRHTLRHGIGVMGVAFTTDRGRGSRLLSLGQDGVTRFWSPFTNPDRDSATPGELHRELLALGRWQGGAAGSLPASGLQVAMNPNAERRQIVAAFGDDQIELRDGE